MKFINGVPDLAVEVRSEGDYGPAGERDTDAKRGEYFAAGTAVVWDVDPVAETITAHRAGRPPAVSARGDVADAEPSLPGFRLSVADVFG